MSGEIDFGNLGLGQFSTLGMERPAPRLEDMTGPAQGSASPHGTAGSDAIPQAGHDLHLSQDLQSLCKGLNDAAQARQARKESFTGSIVKPYSHPNLTRTVMAASKSADVERSSPHKQNLRDSFATVHKPVIFLDGDGFTEYVFVHVDGEWRGFDGAFRPLPGTRGPVDAMMNICGRSNTGMWFTQYDVKGDFRVIEPRTTRPDDAHHDDDGSSADFQRELLERRLSHGSSTSTSTSTSTRSMVSGIEPDLHLPPPAIGGPLSHAPLESVTRRSSIATTHYEVSPLGSPVLRPQESDHE